MVVTGVLAASNVVSNRLIGEVAYVPLNLFVTAVVLAFARTAGCDARAVGLDRGNLPRGLRVGGSVAGAVAGAYALLVLNSGTRAVFEDARAGGGAGVLAWTVLVRIPLGTVVLEEVAFRGVLPALVSRAVGRRWVEVALPSTLFGLWHILPSADLARANSALGGVVGDTGPGLPISSAVVSMTAAGAVLQLLRLAGRSVAAPALVHATTNVLGFAIAWWLRQRA